MSSSRAIIIVETILQSSVFWGVVALVLAAITLSGKFSLKGADTVLIVAWAVSVVGVFRGHPVNAFSVVPRILTTTLVVSVMGLGFYALSVWFHAKEEAVSAPPVSNQPKSEEVPKTVQGTATLEIKPAQPSTSKVVKPHASPSQPKPDLSIVLVYPKAFAIAFINESDVVLREPKYSPGIYNLDRLDASGNPVILPIPVFSGDWIRPHEAMGPQTVISLPTVQPLVNNGDRIFGFIIVSCPECILTKSYWVYAVHGVGGWFYKLPDGKGISIPTLVEAAKKVRENPDTTLAELAPINGRIPIADIAP